MASVTLRMPCDVVEDLKRVAPRLGFSGYQPLIRFYVGQGLRVDLARLDKAADLIGASRRVLVSRTSRVSGDDKRTSCNLEALLANLQEKG